MIPDALMKTPFMANGRTAEGADCYGWARLVLRECFHVTAPEYPIEYAPDDNLSCARAIKSQLAEWPMVKPRSEQPGDVILLTRMGRPSHVGVVLEDGRFAHLEQSAGAPCVESYKDGRWAGRVAAFLRWED